MRIMVAVHIEYKHLTNSRLMRPCRKELAEVSSGTLNNKSNRKLRLLTETQTYKVALQSIHHQPKLHRNSNRVRYAAWASTDVVIHNYNVAIRHCFSQSRCRHKFNNRSKLRKSILKIIVLREPLCSSARLVARLKTPTVALLMSKVVYFRLLNKFKIGIRILIIESYNIIRAIMISWGTLREHLISRDAKCILQQELRIKSRVVVVLVKDGPHRVFDVSLSQEKCLERGCHSQANLIQEMTTDSLVTSDLEVQQSQRIDLRLQMMPLWQQHLLLPSILKITVSVKSPRSQRRRQALKPSQRQSVPNLITCLIFVVVCPPPRSSTWFITRSKLASVFQSARAIWKYK